MANAEHVAILVKGQEAWNRWRSVNVTIDPDLSGANLKTKTLSGFNLRRANLREADLSEAQLFPPLHHQAGREAGERADHQRVIARR